MQEGPRKMLVSRGPLAFPKFPSGDRLGLIDCHRLVRTTVINFNSSRRRFLADMESFVFGKLADKLPCPVMVDGAIWRLDNFGGET